MSDTPTPLHLEDIREAYRTNQIEPQHVAALLNELGRQKQEGGRVQLALDMPVAHPDEWKVETWPEGWTTGPAVGPKGEPPGDYYHHNEVAVIDPKGRVRGHALSPGDYLTQRQAWLYVDARDVYSERLVFGVTQEQAAKGLLVCFADYEKERDRLTTDAQRWANIRSTVIRLDAEARPGAAMGDDDIEDVVRRVLEHAARKTKRLTNALPGVPNAS